MASLAITGQAKIIALAINQVFGFTPAIQVYDDYAQVNFTPEQESIIVKWITDQIDKKRTPGSVRVSIKSIVQTILIKKALPYAVAIFGGGFIIGRKKKKT